ncbi:MAG: lycopene cyclase domain-containing protein [Dehalococcoidia bacterium]|nr:lycopene cyclase domain-containing protein [Dehalococcoidia bacterium]
MTYFRYLGLFLAPPILLFGWLTRRTRDRRDLVTLVGLSAMAVAYTTPWDNLIVLNKVWDWNPKRVTGIVFGVVPLEEYCFFVLQTVATGLFTMFVRKWL